MSLKSHKIDENTLIYQSYCSYTEDGQIIIARKIDENHVVFVDICRDIDGAIETKRFTDYMVHHHYLYNNYQSWIGYDLRKELTELANKYKHLVPYKNRRRPLKSW